VNTQAPFTAPCARLKPVTMSRRALIMAGTAKQILNHLEQLTLFTS
jgi:hypothetical protein